MTLPLRPLIAAAFAGIVVIGGIAVALTYQRAATTEPRRSLTLEPCDIPGAPGGARCGTYQVFENRAAKSGRTINLYVVVIPATSATPQKDPVFWLDGGPGAAATRSVGPVSRQYLRGLGGDRDIVFVDQRGTGRSHPLQCDEIGEDPGNVDRFFGPLFPLESIRACRRKLEQIADLTMYTTAIAMDDLDDVRAALGYEQINLAGASYGTQAAFVYIRQYPARVRSAFLVGVAPPGFRLPLPFARAAQNALDLTLADCFADPVCGAAFPNVRAEFDAVMRRFDAGPLTVTMIDPATKQTRPVTLERESFVERLRTMLYTINGARFVPLVIHQAYLRNYLPFQEIATRFRAGAGLARGMYFSVTCSDSAPFITDEEIGTETAGTFLGDRRVRAHLAACAEWPKGEVPRRFLDPVWSEVPIVLFSGDADGSTPPWIAAEAAKVLANGRHIAATRTGHQVEAPCAPDLMAGFIRNPKPRELDATCASGFRRPPFATVMQQ